MDTAPIGKLPFHSMNSIEFEGDFNASIIEQKQDANAKFDSERIERG